MNNQKDLQAFNKIFETLQQKHGITAMKSKTTVIKNAEGKPYEVLIREDDHVTISSVNDGVKVSTQIGYLHWNPENNDLWIECFQIVFPDEFAEKMWVDGTEPSAQQASVRSIAYKLGVADSGKFDNLALNSIQKILDFYKAVVDADVWRYTIRVLPTDTDKKTVFGLFLDHAPTDYQWLILSDWQSIAEKCDTQASDMVFKMTVND